MHDTFDFLRRHEVSSNPFSIDQERELLLFIFWKHLQINYHFFYAQVENLSSSEIFNLIFNSISDN